jgi:uncharacterized protein (TIGR03083 family)
VEWLDALITGFEAFSPRDHDHPVPACPGWDIRNVLAHVAYGSLLFWVVPSTHSAMAGINFGDLFTAAGDGQGVRLLPGALRALSLIVRTHRADDAVPVVVGEQTFGNLAGLATTELAVHLLDCHDALGRPRPLTPPHASAAVAWTVEAWLPALTALDRVAVPAGRVEVMPNTFLGTGDIVAELRGDPVEVLLHLWGRPATVEVAGDTDIIAYWTGLTARTTAVPGRS